MPSSTRIKMPQTEKPGKKNKTGNSSTDNRPVYEANIPEPTTRAEMIKYWISLSLDDKTANKVLWLQEGGTKVSRLKTEVCPCLDRPERFEHYPQVLCKESIWASRCYWEVLCSGWVVIGMTYADAGRRGGPCGLGENEESWALGWDGSCYDAWHNGISTRISDVPHYSTIGVYVDQPAGLISFYAVETVENSESKELKLIHRFENPINKTIVPGFWMGRESSCLILKKEE